MHGFSEYTQYMRFDHITDSTGHDLSDMQCSFILTEVFTVDSRFMVAIFTGIILFILLYFEKFIDFIAETSS